MAIGKYKNIMRSAPFVTTVNELNSAIGEEKKNIIAKLSNNKSAFNTQLTQAQAKQMQLFRELGIKTSAGDSQTALMELNKRIRDYQQITLNLSGRGLYKNFMMSLEEEGIKNIPLFEAAAKEVMEEFFDTDYAATIQKAEGTIGEKVQQIVTQGLSTSTQHFSSKAGYNLSLNTGNAKENILDFVRIFDLTLEQRKQLVKKIEEKAAKDKRSKNKEKTAAQIYIDSKVSDDKTIMTWFSITNKSTPTKAEKMKNLSQKNQQLKNLILRNSGVPGEYRYLLEEAIDHVLLIKSSALFVGKNEKEIIGILGEIQSLFYLYLLVGNKKGKVIWKGGTSQGKNNAKPHQDIVFRELGIQVKNTTKDLFSHETDFLVNFKEVKLTEFLNTLNLSGYTRDIFENYFGMFSFNVPYIYDGTNYKQSEKATDETEAGRNFNQARNIMDTSMQTDIDTLLSLFASTLMYLAVSKTNIEDTNTLFILGGVSAITAAAILEEIKEDVLANEKVPFMVNGYQKLEGQNIVGVLQNIKIHQGKEIETRSENIIDTISISTRYNFKNLISYYK